MSWVISIMSELVVLARRVAMCCRFPVRKLGRGPLTPCFAIIFWIPIGFRQYAEKTSHAALLMRTSRGANSRKSATIPMIQLIDLNV